MIKTIFLPAALALATLAGAASTAHATDAFTTSNLNVRSGPGTSYSVVGTLAAGTRVHLDYCRDSWCKVEQGTLRGLGQRLTSRPDPRVCCDCATTHHPGPMASSSP